MTLDLYDARIRGTFTHDSDYIVMRGFIHANENLLLLEIRRCFRSITECENQCKFR